MLLKIEQILKDYKSDDELSVTETTTFEELELDSLDMAELIMNIEDEFSVTIEMSNTIKTIGDLMKLVENNK